MASVSPPVPVAPSSSSPSVLIPVADACQILNPAVGADTMAVLGAMMSRTPDLAQKIDAVLAKIAEEDGVSSWDFRAPPTRIRQFLEANLAAYGHASIASMAKAIWIYAHGFGWPSAWLLLGSPKFDGQEVSTRAVDATMIPGADGRAGTPCRFAPPSLAPIHAAWLELYAAAKATVVGGGWKFDDARLFLPGSVPTGVVFTMDARDLARQLDHVRALGGFGADLSNLVYAGLDASSPAVTASIGRKTRQPLMQWTVGWTVRSARELAVGTQPGALVRVEPWDVPRDGRVWNDLLRQTTARPAPSRHLDPLWKHAPRFRVSLVTTVAVARDWHRHRPSMPWQIRVVSDDETTGRLALAPWAPLADAVPAALLAETSLLYYTLGGQRDAATPHAAQFEALHALPFGALMELEAVCSLPDLVYMLELRYATKGANPEYRAQAGAALEQLCALLPRTVVEREQLDGVLRRDEGVHPI